jgi:hypothetical protein
MRLFNFKNATKLIVAVCIAAMAIAPAYAASGTVKSLTIRGSSNYVIGKNSSSDVEPQTTFEQQSSVNTSGDAINSSEINGNWDVSYDSSGARWTLLNADYRNSFVKVTNSYSASGHASGSIFYFDWLNRMVVGKCSIKDPVTGEVAEYYFWDRSDGDLGRMLVNQWGPDGNWYGADGKRTTPPSSVENISM